MAKYYSKITQSRMSELLGLNDQVKTFYQNKKILTKKKILISSGH